jgi:trehalose 6-phosphate synthase/phosphatase
MVSTSARLLLASHRLPVTIEVADGRAVLSPSCGGLATGLGSLLGNGTTVWFGSLGNAAVSGAERARLATEAAARGLCEIRLEPHEYHAYYEVFANGVLWPLFHYMPDRIPLDSAGWHTYREVNDRFADAIADVYHPGDIVWVHDYHLMLVPALLRERIRAARIGFFLHIPFPAYEVFRMLPWRRELLEGLLGADLVGFHTAAYVRYFSRALRHVLGVDAGLDGVAVNGRQVRFRASSMGIDTTTFEQLAADPAVQASARAIRTGAGGRRLVVGVDRLDYTKGIPRRLLAFERLLGTHAELREQVRLIQLAVPCRGGVESYQSFRRQLEELVGRVNGALGSSTSVPIHYMHRSVSRQELVALYLAADVMAVTPLRDGMNLVAKEFIASRIDDDGVLLLSEFAGAAEELAEALIVNPYDIEGTAAALARALALPRDERAARMRALRRRVQARTVRRWAQLFVEELRSRPEPPLEDRSTDGTAVALRTRLAAMPDPVLLLDYDGTLVPFTSLPDLARPDAALEALVADVAARAELHLVSGRSCEDLDTWFGRLPATLWAEHGAWRRDPGCGWRPTEPVTTDWMDDVRPLLERFAAATPGAVVEEKRTALVWHYRGGDAEFAEQQAGRLRNALAALLADRPVDLLDGSRVLEVRARGISKAGVARRLLASGLDPARLVAIGDDTTDEEMFAALPPPAVTIRVGRGPTRARHRLPDPASVRTLLAAIAQPALV